MNKTIFKSIMGTVDQCPYAPRSKMIDPAIGAALVTAGGGIINSLFGSSSNSSTNSTNLEIARLNNEQQYKMFKEQQAYNLDMWNKQNAYNDPKAQTERLLAAGINPAAVFGNGSIAQAGNLISPDAPQMQRAQINPYQPDLKVGDAVNAFMQSQLMNAQRKKMDAETKHTEQLNMFDMESMDSRLKSLQAMAKRDDALGQIAQSELSYLQDSYYWRLKSLRNDIVSQEDQHRLTQKQIYNHELQNALAEVQLAYAPRMNEAQLKQYYTAVQQMKASIGLINANTMLTKAQKNTEVERAIGEFYKNAGLDFDAQIKGKIKDAVIGIENLNYENYESDRFHRIFQGYLGAANNAMQGGSSAAALKILLGK